MQFHVAQEIMRCWCMKFEHCGQSAVAGAAQQSREMGLQRWELGAQSNREIDSMLQRFKSEIQAHLKEREHRVEKILQGFHTHV